MIAAEVKTSAFSHMDTKLGGVNTQPLEKWCYLNLGTKAEFRDQVAPHLAPHPNARERQSLVGRWACQDPRWQNRGQANPGGRSGLNELTT